MSRMLRVVLPLFLVLLATAGGGLVASGNQPRTPPWWQNPDIISKVGIKPDQIARIEAIWKETSEEFRGEMEELDRREAKLISMIEQGAEEAVVIRQIPRVESARANLAATRAVIAYRMRQVLTAPQRKMMESLAPPPQPLTPRQGTPGARPPSTSGSPSSTGSTPPSSPSRGSSSGRPAAPPR